MRAIVALQGAEGDTGEPGEALGQPEQRDAQPSQEGQQQHEEKTQHVHRVSPAALHGNADAYCKSALSNAATGWTFLLQPLGLRPFETGNSGSGFFWGGSVDFATWSKANGQQIVARWIDWCDYAIKYGHHFDAQFRIPVPQFFFDGYRAGSSTVGKQVDDYFRQQFAAGNPVTIPNPVPAPPSNNFAGRAMQHGQASQTTGEAMWRGAKEGMKSQAPKAAATLLGLLFGRR